MFLLTQLWTVYEWVCCSIPGNLGFSVRKLTIAPFLKYSGDKLSSMWQVRISEYVHLWNRWNITFSRDVSFG